MKKTLLTLTIALCSLLGYSQDTIRSLIFSEYRGDAMQNCYFELTNVGTSTLDLSRFTISSFSPWHVYPTFIEDNHHDRLSGTLAPGKSYVLANVWEQRAYGGGPSHTEQLLAKADRKVYVWEGVPGDSVSKDAHGNDKSALVRQWMGQYAAILWYNLDNGDSVMIDEVNLLLNPANNMLYFKATDVAGVVDATATHVLVRKANVKQGNPDWDKSRGVDLEDSEWMPVPFRPATNGDIFTTVGNHGDYHVAMTSSVLGVNLAGSTLTVPWGIVKGDSIIDEVTLGDGMSWYYNWAANVEDSAYSIVRTGDVLTLYACGNILEQKDLAITVSEPANNMALVFPRLTKIRTLIPTIEGSPREGWAWIAPYYVTEEHPVIDSIGNVPFATRVDSMFKYLIKAPKASWEIQWVDGVERVDLKRGDILRVTAENGTTTKEYFIDVLKYSKSHNALLSAITWPDIPEPLEKWKNDTIPGFTSNLFSYNIKLPYGTNFIPALKFTPDNLNAKIKVKRATSLNGKVSDRTTEITVTSEDGLMVNKYTILFDVEALAIQEFHAEPFFSQVVYSQFWEHTIIEVVNPGNVPLSLDRYYIIGYPGRTPASAITTGVTTSQAHANSRYRRYIPGFKWQTPEEWMVKPCIAVPDLIIDPILDAGEVFSLGRFGDPLDRQPPEKDLVDLQFSTGWKNVWGENGWDWTHLAVPWIGSNSTLYLFRIDNDSVLNGSKPGTDPNDYTIVDVFGAFTAKNWNVAGREILDVGWDFVRKPDVWHGNIESEGSFGTNADNSEWSVLNYNDGGVPWPNSFLQLSYGIGGHAMNPATVYISTVKSLVYLVSKEFAGLQSVEGNLASTNVNIFNGNLIKADEGQQLAVHSAVNGAVKAGTDAVAGGDTLYVTSTDSKNITKYLLINQPLDADATLVAVTGSGLTIAVHGNTGTITGVQFGETLSSVLANVTVPGLASLSVINQDNELVPLKFLNYDDAYVNTIAGDNVYFEVVAQSGFKVVYKLVPEILTSDAYVISAIYNVDQDLKVISGLPNGTSVPLFFKNIEVVKGATYKLVDKIGFARDSGYVQFDDKLVVVSQDLSKRVEYYVTFFNEVVSDQNLAPVLTTEFTALDMHLGTVSLKATVTDDGKPLPAQLTTLWEVVGGNAADVNILTPDQLITDVEFSQLGTYTLRVSVSDGQLTSTVDVVITTNNVGIAQHNQASVRIYPNPVSNILNIDLNNSGEISAKIRITDIIGKSILSTNLYQNKTQINLSSIEPGMYFITVTSGGNSYTQKFQKVK